MILVTQTAVFPEFLDPDRPFARSKANAMVERKRLLSVTVGILLVVAADPARGGQESTPGGRQPAEVTAAGGAPAAEPIELLGEAGPALTSALQGLAPGNDNRGFLVPLGVVRASYRAALDLLSQGKLERACEALVRLEAPASRSARMDSMDVLGEAEIEVARRLDEIDGGSLYPLVTMHEELVGQYLRWGHERLADHSIRMATEIATLFVTKAGDGSAREIAAGALATLAAGLAEAGTGTGLLDVLRDALTIDPDNEPALLLMAVHLETHGRPEAAVTYLQRLVAAHRDCREGALHLAVCLRRTGSPVPAELLNSCLESPSPPWVRAVAFDELARQALDRSDWKGAIAVLSEAVQARPDLIGPRIQLAYACDRAGRPADGLAAIGGVTAAPMAGPEPRKTYGQPVPDAVRRERGRIAASTGLHLATLAEALARTTAPPER